MEDESTEHSKKKRKAIKSTLNPFRVTFDARDGSGKRRAFHCTKVRRVDSDYRVDFRDTTGLVGQTFLPISDWALRGEAEILFDEPEPTVLVPVTTPSREDDQPRAMPKEDPGDLKASLPGEYNATDAENWHRPVDRIPLKAHVESNFAIAEGMRKMELARHRSELSRRTSAVGSGWEIDS